MRFHRLKNKNGLVFSNFAMRLPPFMGLLSLSFLLQGCAGMNSHFDCPMKPGVQCKRLDQVNGMVDNGSLGAAERGNGHGNVMATFTPAALQGQTEKADIEPYPMPALNQGDPLRVQESVMRIWVAPYQDAAGNYYQPSYVYTVIQPAHWMATPPIALTADGDIAEPLKKGRRT